jgi:hypothetical protein
MQWAATLNRRQPTSSAGENAQGSAVSREHSTHVASPPLKGGRGDVSHS